MLGNFPGADDVNAFKTEMSYSLSLKGKVFVADEFLKSDSYPCPVRVLLNRNKYKHRHLSGMFAQSDSSAISSANARLRRTLPSFNPPKASYLAIKVDELNLITKRNAVDIAVIAETWFKADTLNLGTIQGYCTTHSTKLVRAEKLVFISKI